jgi:hypothetical protein
LDFDFGILYAVLSFLALIGTLKLSLTGQITVGPAKKSYVLFHPVWLGSLVVMVPLIIGWYLHGVVSPWPPAAFATMEAKGGLWAGIAAGLATTTIDLWLFWTTATALITFTVPMATIYEPIPKPMHKYFHVVNVIAGAFVVYKALTAGA